MYFLFNQMTFKLIILSTEVIYIAYVYIFVNDYSFCVTQCTYTEKNGKSILSGDW